MSDDFSMTFYTGRPGDGKTTTMTFQAFNNFLYAWDCLRCRARFMASGGIKCTECGESLRDNLIKVRVYSNYHLEFPHILVKTLDEFDKMRHAFGAFDELWRWADARESMKSVQLKGGKKAQRNRIVTMILGAARKRHVEISYTAQLKRQMDVRIREVTDTIVKTKLNKKNGICEIFFFDYLGIDYPFTVHNLIEIKKYRFPPMFDMFDTDEEIDELIIEDELIGTEENPIKLGAA